MKKKRKLNKYSILFLIFLIIFILGIICYACYSKPFMWEKHMIKENKNYHMKISYPILHKKKIDRVIQTMVSEKKKEFLDTVKKEAKNNPTISYDFILEYHQNTFEEIEIIHFTILSYIGGNHYIREDISYYYDQAEKKLKTSLDLLKKDALSKLSQLSYYAMMEKNEKEKLGLTEEQVKEGTKGESKNYRHIVIKQEGLEVLFPPYQVGPWSVGEQKITIPFVQLEGILKKQYMRTTKEEKNDIIKQVKRDLTLYQNKKLLVFTFDDGPGYQTTEKLLNELKSRDARVTFFVLGSRVEQLPDIVKRAYQEGHEIGSHTYHHKNLFRLTDYEIHREIEDTNQIIKKTIGIKPTYLREPYGNTNSSIRKISNMYSILWNVDTEDWKLKNKEAICQHIVDHAKDGKIMLLHDIYEFSVEGVLMAMDLLKEEYAFVTIREMLELKGIKLDQTKSYYGF